MNLAPYNYATTLTKSDTVNIPPVQNETLKAIYIGTTGNLVAVYGDGSTQLFKALPAGYILPITCVRVNSTSTTTADMLALFVI